MEEDIRRQAPIALPDMRFQLPRTTGCKKINLKTPENNPGWRTRWFYTKDKPATTKNIGLKEFCAANDLRPKQSWEHTLMDEEMAIKEPLMQKIAKLQSAPGKEVTGVQLIRTFIKCRIQ
jgi:hypothetical protein